MAMRHKLFVAVAAATLCGVAAAHAIDGGAANDCAAAASFRAARIEFHPQNYAARPLRICQRDDANICSSAAPLPIGAMSQMDAPLLRSFVPPGAECVLSRKRITAPANLTRKFSASRWALRPAPVRSLRRSRLPARDRPGRGPVESPDRILAGPAAGLDAMARRRRSSPAAGRCRAGRAARGRPRSWSRAWLRAWPG